MTEENEVQGLELQEQVQPKRQRRTKTSKPKNAERAPRVPMSAGGKLGLDGTESPEFYYRWVQDRDGNVEQALQAWYEFDLDSSGNKKERASGPYKLYRMKLPMQHRLDDEKLKLKACQAKIAEEQKLGKEEYLPDDRHHAIQKDEYDPLA